METLHSWVTGLCFAAVISAVVSVLNPNGALEKSVKSIISIFLICAMIIPLFSEKISINSNSSIILDESNDTASDLNNEVLTQTKSYVKSSVENILKNNGISYEEVIIEMEMTESSVSINSVTVTGVKTDTEKVKEILYKEIGINAEVVQ